MSKSLFIAEKPSVAQEFAKALKLNTSRKDGYLESENTIVTWCVGHLVTMSYPEAYDPALKRWSLDTLPFLPEDFKYEVIPSVKKQFDIVSGLLNRKDVETIYVCTDSGREGEYIYRLVAMMAGVKDKEQKRVWIDSQTEEEIIRGIREAKSLSEYDNLSASAYLRAKEDYLMGINFSRLLSLKYGNAVSNYLGSRYQAISVGRVMTCVLGMVVRREREIREFVKTPFYRVLGKFELQGHSFDNAVLYILDPKNSDLADLGTVMPNVYHTKEEMIDCVNAFYEGMVQRSEEMKRHPNYKTGENYAYLGLPPCFLIFDEYVAFFEMLGTKESVSLLSQLKKIVMLGRQAGYFLIVACQRPDAKYFSDGIRDNFNFRVGLGRISELGYGMLFGSDVKKQFFQKRIKGRGYCDVGTSVISEFYTPLVPKGHDFLQTIGRLAQERQAMPEQQGKEDVIE